MQGSSSTSTSTGTSSSSDSSGSSATYSSSYSYTETTTTDDDESSMFGGLGADSSLAAVLGESSTKALVASAEQRSVLHRTRCQLLHLAELCGDAERAVHKAAKSEVEPATTLVQLVDGDPSLLPVDSPPLIPPPAEADSTVPFNAATISHDFIKLGGLTRKNLAKLGVKDADEFASLVMHLVGNIPAGCLRTTTASDDDDLLDLEGEAVDPRTPVELQRLLLGNASVKNETPVLDEAEDIDRRVGTKSLRGEEEAVGAVSPAAASPSLPPATGGNSRSNKKKQRTEKSSNTTTAASATVVGAPETQQQTSTKEEEVGDGAPCGDSSSSSSAVFNLTGVRTKLLARAVGIVKDAAEDGRKEVAFLADAYQDPKTWFFTAPPTPSGKPVLTAKGNKEKKKKKKLDDEGGDTPVAAPPVRFTGEAPAGTRAGTSTAHHLVMPCVGPTVADIHRNMESIQHLHWEASEQQLAAQRCLTQCAQHLRNYRELISMSPLFRNEIELGAMQLRTVATEQAHVVRGLEVLHTSLTKEVQEASTRNKKEEEE